MRLIRLHHAFHPPAPDAAKDHEDAYLAINEAFRAMRRQLQDHARRLRGDVKFPLAPGPESEPAPA